MSSETDSIIAFVRAAVPAAQVTATLGHYLNPTNPCAPHSPGSLHCADATGGKGLAVDFGAPMEPIFRALEPVAGQLAELIHNGPGITRAVKAGQWVDPLKVYGATVWAAHTNHVHVGVPRGVLLVAPAARPAEAVAAAGSGPPTVTATPYPEGENMLTRHDVNIPALDGQGRGWVELDVPAGQVVSVIANGPYPPVDGYWEMPVVARQDRGGKTIVSVTEGAPNQPLMLAVWSLG